VGMFTEILVGRRAGDLKINLEAKNQSRVNSLFCIY
jgi:hypothetical protein